VAGIDQLNAPSFTTIVWLTIVDPTQSDRVDLTLSSGAYGLVCQDVKSPTLWSAYVVGPFRVP
jgi:hypothetical protein